MPKFTYTGEDELGHAVTQTVDAADRFAVYEIARSNGHTVSHVSEATSIGGFSFKLLSLKKINEMLSRVSSDQLVMMTRNLSSMLTAGLPLTRALSVIERQSDNLKMKQVMVAVRENINKGKQFHESLELYPKLFSDLYTAMVRAGEEGGQLSEALGILSLQMEQSSSLKKKIRGAMIYPSIVIIVMIIIGIIMMIYVVPSVTSTFVKLDIELPTTTKILIFTSSFMSEHAIATLVGMFAIVGGFVYFLRTTYGKIIFHFLIVRIPVIGKIAKEVNAARTARTLSSLLTAGVDVIHAIKITEDVVQNIYYKKILAEAAQRVEKGSSLSEIFIEKSNLYPVLVGEMISVGEETGQISNMLRELAVFYEKEIDQKTKDLSTIIEPILMVVIGSAVGFFALAIIAPIYSISDSI